MKLTPELKEIALKVAEEVYGPHDPECFEIDEFRLQFSERFLAALPNSEPVAVVIDTPISDPCGDVQIWLSRIHSSIPLDEGVDLYAAQPIPQDVTFPVMLDEERAKYVAREVKYEEKLQDYKAQLAESQAREAKLRKALESYKWQIEGGLICVPNGSINEALDTQPDATALNEMIAKAGEVMRERCFQTAQPEDSYQDEWFSAKADSSARIRSLPGVTMEDL